MALSRHQGVTQRPYSVEEITRQAQDFEFSPNRALKNWLRSAQLLLTEAAICEQDGELQKAYLYLIRHAELVLGKFPTHPEYKDPKLKGDLAQAQKAVQKNLVKLEQWKPKLNQEYERGLKALERRNAEKRRIHQQQLDDQRERMTNGELLVDSRDAEDVVSDDGAEALNASEHRQLAVDLAHREIRRRDATKQSTRRAGISPGTVAARRRGVVVDDRDDGYERDQRDLGKVSEGIQEAGRHLHPERQQPSSRVDRQSRAGTSSYQYPSVPTKENIMRWDEPPSREDRRADVSGPPPSIPAKEALDQGAYQRDRYAPPVPPKATKNDTLRPSPPLEAQIPSKYTFKPTAFTEGGSPLRTVMLPPELRFTFLNIANQNTLRSLETCGILCGTLISNALFINHLIIPDQISTSDTCDTTEEGDNRLFDYCDSNELLVCGWIHTHPTQSCFLSSRDLHTSSGYQIMLPEAISIVCAPKHNPDWGIFRLTDPPGLPHVLHCEKKGLFHPHEETNLYTDALRPGHVVEGPGLKFEVVDLRKR